MTHDNYNEYLAWLESKKEFLETLQKDAPNIASEFELELVILDALYQLREMNTPLDEDQDDVFFFGFDYLNYVYDSLELLCEQLYENDYKVMDEFVDDILAYIYIDTLIINVEMELGAIEGEHQDTLNKLDELLEETENLLKDKETITYEFVEKVEAEISEILAKHMIEIYLDDELLIEYAEEHGIIEFEDEE